MRPGYPLLLEWGWNPYVTKDGEIEQFPSILEEFFEEDQDLNSLNKLILEKKIAAEGNHEYLLKNSEIYINFYNKQLRKQ